jgi:GNAT superfamily N-acetyltransferase
VTVAVESTADPAAALAKTFDFLLRQPMHNSVALTVLHQRAAGDGVEGRYWWATEEGEVTGFALQSPASFRALVAPAARHVVQALAAVMAVEAPAIPGVMSEAAAASTFAGHWAEVVGVVVAPTEAQRLFHLCALTRPPAVAGRLRPAESADRPLLDGWAAAFLTDIGEAGAFDPSAMVDRQLAGGRLFLWDDGGPVSMAHASPVVGGVSRIGPVYTPPEHRRRGYAAACVAELSARTLGSGAETCVLYTQLSNPTSNALYRRLGYEPVAEVLLYRFG